MLNDTKLCALSENTINAALRYMGFGSGTMTDNGFGAMARTVLDEELGCQMDHIEHQLAHAIKDANGRAHSRITHLPAQRKMMQTRVDYLGRLQIEAKVVPLARHSM